MVSRSKALFLYRFGLSLSIALLAVSVAAQERSWPSGDADPVVRWERTVRNLSGYEIAIQGPVGGSAQTARKLKRPSGLAFDQRGRLLVSDSRQGLLLQIDPDLGVVLVLGSGTEPSLRQPMGVDVHSDGRVFVADAGLQQVVAFDAEGQIAAVYGAGSLEQPADVALSPDGQRLFVADAGADRVAIFDVASGNELDAFGGRGKGAGEFHLPTAVEFDANGHLMVVDQINSRVQVFDAAGAFTRAIQADGASGFSRPRDVAVDPAGRVYLTDSAQSRVQVYDSGLVPIFALGRNGLGDGEFLGVGAIAVRNARLAVLDRAGGRVQLFEISGLPEKTVERQEIEPMEATTLEPSEPMPAEVPQEMPEARPPVPETPPSDPAEVEAVVEEAISEASLEVEQIDEPEARDEIDVPEAEAEPEVPEIDPSAVAAQELHDALHGWAAAWSSQDPDSYLAFYADGFAPADGTPREAWAANRRDRLTAPSSIAVEVEIVDTQIDASSADVTFLQSYTSDRFSDRVRKVLRFVRENGAWKIASEAVVETL